MPEFAAEGARYLVVVRHGGRNPVMIHTQDLEAALSAAQSLRVRFGEESVEVIDFEADPPARLPDATL